MGYTCARAGGRACVCVRVYVHACVRTSVRAFACVRMCVCARVQQAAFGVGGRTSLRTSYAPVYMSNKKGPGSQHGMAPKAVKQRTPCRGAL